MTVAAEQHTKLQASPKSGEKLRQYRPGRSYKVLQKSDGIDHGEIHVARSLINNFFGSTEEVTAGTVSEPKISRKDNHQETKAETVTKLSKDNFSDIKMIVRDTLHKTLASRGSAD
jgi:hypothetical protein